MLYIRVIELQDAAERERAQRERVLAMLHDQLGAAEAELLTRHSQLEQARAGAAEAEARAHERQRRYELIVRSASWRLTRPLRRLASRLRQH